MVLSVGDLKAIRKIVLEETSGLREEFLKHKDDVNSLQEDVSGIKRKVNLLPTKEEFFSKMDKVMGELKTIREEQVTTSHSSSRHEDRIKALEDIHPAGTHATK